LQSFRTAIFQVGKKDILEVASHIQSIHSFIVIVGNANSSALPDGILIEKL
jgi:hypothetical protein